MKVRRGRKFGPWLAWVKKEDSEQCEWVRDQLRGMVRTIIDAEKNPYDAIMDVVSQWPDPNSGAGSEDIRQMCQLVQRRWCSHRKRTRDPHKRNYTFFMEKSLAPKIAKIAKHLNTTEEGALGRLIYLWDEERKAAAAQFRVEMKPETNKLKRKIDELQKQLSDARKDNGMPKNVRSLQKRLGAKEAELIKLHQASRHWLRELSLLKVQVRDLGLAATATPNQIDEAEAACVKMLEDMAKEAAESVAAIGGRIAATVNGAEPQAISMESDSVELGGDTESSGNLQP